MKNIIKTTVLTAVFALATTSMFAQVATSTIQVSANVTKVCTITTTTDLAFGTYDPITGAAKDETAPAVVSIACTKGATPALTLATTTPLTEPISGDTLAFNVYEDAGHLTVWNGVTLVAAPSKAARTVQIWGRITAGQDVSDGTYAGVVTATINY